MPLVIRLPHSTKARVGIFGGAAFLVFLAILIPSVTLRSTEEPLSPEMLQVLEVLKEVPVIDTHNDLPYQFYKLVGNHIDLLDIRKNMTGTLHTDIDKLRQGGVGAVFFAAYSDCDTQYKDAVEFGFTMIDLIHRLANQHPDIFEMAYTAKEIEKIQKREKIAILIGVEGGHMINSNLAILRLMYQMGVRYMTLTHSCHTPWADAYIADTVIPETKHDYKYEEGISNGLSIFGKMVVAEMNRLGMMVDISHVSVDTMKDAIRVSQAPVIFSHSSAFGVCRHRRNVNDEVLHMLRENHGVLMINFWSNVVRCTDDFQNATIDDIVVHINYVRDLIGVDYIGMGADYDGVPILPQGSEDVSKYPNLFAKLLEDPKWTPEDIKKIAGKNILRVMEEVELVAAKMRNSPPNDENLDYCKIVGEKHCRCRVMEDITLTDENQASIGKN